MSDYETLLLETSDGVATLTLNRPDRYNAFDATMVAGITRPGRSCETTPTCVQWS